jgi:DNA helicase-2/ATP-dependent DNA helicase PcrA
MSKENWRELSDQTDFDFGWDQKDPEMVENIYTALPDVKTVLGLITMARLKQITIRQAYDSWEEAYKYPWPQILYLSKCYEDYRKSTRSFDFTDMLTVFLEQADQLCPSFHTVFVDEAQDLSRLQWRVVQAIADKSDRVIVAGDDDQAIFRWAGADVDSFLELPGASETLSKSWRVPVAVHALAETIASRISDRYPKTYTPQERYGEVHYVHSIRSIIDDLKEGTWLVLAQCAYMLDDAEEEIRTAGLFYEMKNRKSVPEKVLMAIAAWKKLQADKDIDGKEVRAIYSYLHVGNGLARGFKAAAQVEDDDLVTYEDLVMNVGLLADHTEPWHTVLTKMPEAHRVYLRAVENRGENISERPRITLSTIHGAKGGEADNVVLYTDISYASVRESNASQEGDNDLHRTFYVGVTRTKQQLFLMSPHSVKESYLVE